MGADIKSLRQRIKSVDSTLHLTKAMGLVASSKIRKANEKMAKSKDYADAIFEVIKCLSSFAECQSSPYMRSAEGKKTKLIVIAGDRGMAGGYNANVFRLLKQYPDTEIIPIGKRICEKKGMEFVSSEHFNYSDAKKLADSLCEGFVKGEYDKLEIIYTKYVSLLLQEPVCMTLLPIEKPEKKSTTGIIFEPDRETVMKNAVPEYVAAMIIAKIKESFASEVTARRTAMDSAGKNAQTMIDDLQLSYNRARQGAITQEITEIVAGSGN